MNHVMTVAQFKDALPSQLKKSVNQELIDNVIYSMGKEPEEMETYRDNLISYVHVLKDGKFKIEQYVDAVRYVSFKLMGLTNLDSYTRTFPKRYATHLANGTTPKAISSYVSIYNKSKLVNLIFEQTLIPIHIMNADKLQQAINTQASIMLDEDVSPKVRSDAANSLMTHLKPPETRKLELEVNHKQDSVIAVLQEQTTKLVAQQRVALQSGSMNASEVANQSITFNSTCEEVN